MPVDDVRNPPTRDRVDRPFAHLTAEPDGQQGGAHRELGGPGNDIEPVKGRAQGSAQPSVVRREVGEPPIRPVADHLGRGDPRQDRVGDALAEQRVRRPGRVPGENGAPRGQRT